MLRCIDVVYKAGPPLRPQGGLQQPPRPQAPPGQPVAGPPRPFLPGGAVQPPPGPRGPPLLQQQQRPSGPNSFAPQQPRPLQPQGVPPQGPPYQGPPLQPGQPPRPQGPPPPGQRPAPFEKQNSFQQRPPAPFLNPGSRQSSLASLGSNPNSPGPHIRPPVPNMEPEGTPPAVVKNRSFSIAGPPGAVPGVPLHDEERRKSVSVIGARPEEGVSRGPGLAFIKEGVQSFENKESPLNVGLTRLSKEDVTRGSRESVRSDSSDGKGGTIDRPESRLSGSRMTESIIGSLDTDERKVRKNVDDDDDVVIQNNKHPNVQNGKSPIQENGKSPAPSIDRSPSLTRTDSSPDQKPAPADNRSPSVLSNASKTPEPKAPTPVGQRPPSATPSRDTPDLKNGTQEINSRPISRAGSKPTDLGTPIKTGTPDDSKKATPVRKAASAPRARRGIYIEFEIK